MKKKALWKDVWKEISNNKARFLALFAIIALGVGFYGGISAAGPDMLAIADKYFHEHKLFDLKVLSTYGIVSDDLKALEEVDDLIIEPTKTIDVALQDEAYLLRLYPYEAAETSINDFSIVRGRLPNKKGEIALDAGRGFENSFKIGDAIKFDFQSQSENDSEEESIELVEQVYTIVGFVDSPLYIENLSRGNTQVGKGTLDGFGVVSKEDIIGEIYSEVNIQFEENKNLTAYSEEYEEYVDEKADEIEVTLNGRPLERINEIRSEARKEIFDAERELEDAKKQLQEAEQELQKARAELDEGSQTYNENKAVFDQEIAEAEAEIARQQEQIDAGWAEYQEGLASWRANARTYADAKVAWEIQREELLQQLDSAVSLEALAEKPIPTPEGEELGKQIQKLFDGEREIEQARKQLEAHGRTLQEQEQQLNEAQQKLNDDKKRAIVLEQEAEELINLIALQKEILIGKQEQLAYVKQAIQVPFEDLTDEEKAKMANVISEQGDITQLYQPFLAYLNGEVDKNGIPVEQEENAQNSVKEAVANQEAELSSIQTTIEELRISDREAELLEQGQILVNAQKLYGEGSRKIEQSASELARAKNILQNKVQSAMQNIQSQVAIADRQFSEQGEALEIARAELEAARNELQNGQAQLDQGYEELNKERDAGAAALAEAWEELQAGEEEYASGLREFEEERTKAEEEIMKGEQELSDAKNEIAALDEPIYFVQDRTVNPGYQSYRDNANRISAIASIFPVFFFLIAALVSFTTMTRMVDEQRQQMGTLKGLGYGSLDIAKKFIVYAAAACFGGTIVGLLIGYHLFPTVIFMAYSTLYRLPDIEIHYYFSYGLISLVVALLCTIGPAAVTAYKELKESPASLMRPKAPKSGKRVLLERIPFVWNRLGFNGKITVRNLVRYKLRNSMTIIGVAGSTALILTGFAITNSISGLANTQFNEVTMYDAVVALEENISEEDRNEYIELIDSYDEIENHLFTFQTSYKTDRAGISIQDVTVFVPENTEIFSGFVNLQERETADKYPLTDEGAIITEKLASLMELEPGDELTIRDDQAMTYRIPIQAIAENYTGHYLYMTPGLYERIFSENYLPNTDLLIFNESGNWERTFAEEAMNAAQVMLVTFMDVIDAQFTDTLSILDLVTVILIISAAALAFIVLYNLTNVNVSERIRELSTIKVLGFYHTEVSMYIYRETFILTLIGVFVGFGLGNILATVILKMVEVDFMLFPTTILLSSYFYSSILTILFSVIVMVIMHYKLKQVDMIEALKSVE